MQGQIVIALSLLGLSSAFLFTQKKWDGLKVTFGANPFDSNVFASLPRTESDAKSQGWTKIADCDNNGKFRGIRYVKNNDYAVVLLYDVNGYIAGIQAGIQKTANYPPAKQIGKVFQADSSRYTVTAYFTDPAHICQSGRTAAQFSNDGTGNALFIQNGSNPVTQSVRIPMTQDAVGNTQWTLGRCFPAMGVHYWYDTSEHMSCDDFQPIFLLYNQKRLTAFGWAMGSPETSPRFEHPPKASIAAFMNPVPQCLYDYPNLSTMHIYLTAHALQDLC